jgi:hypothetical protein
MPPGRAVVGVADAAAPRWVPIATYASAPEAEIGRAVLEAGGFAAHVEGGELTGIFGPGFSGPTPRGVRLLVPSDRLAAARTYLAFRARRDEEGEGAG